MNQRVRYYRADCAGCQEEVWGLATNSRPGSGWEHTDHPADEHRAVPSRDTVEELDFATWQGLSFK